MIAGFLEREHAEMERLLAAGAFDEFRQLLLRHIAIEEKLLLPAAREARGGEPLPVAAQLRRDHAELARLLVWTLDAASIADIRALLARHNPLEEGPDGLYAECERLLGAEGSQRLLERARAMPKVKVAAWRPKP